MTVLKCPTRRHWGFTSKGHKRKDVTEIDTFWNLQISLMFKTLAVLRRTMERHKDVTRVASIPGKKHWRSD